MVQERGLVPSSFLQTGARRRTPTKGVILHSSQEGLSGLPGRHAHHTQCHSACPDSLSGVCHTKGDELDEHKTSHSVTQLTVKISLLSFLDSILSKF